MAEEVNSTSIEIQKLKNRAEWIDYITKFNPTHILTLTFANKSDLSTRHIKSSIVTKFNYQMNNIIFGSKSYKAHKCAVFSELDTNDRKHFHILIRASLNKLSRDKVERLIRTYCKTDITLFLDDPIGLEDLLYLEIIKKTWIDVGKSYEAPTGTANFKQSLGVNEGFKRIGRNEQDLMRAIEYVIKNEPSISGYKFSASSKKSEHEGFIAAASNISGYR
jgi:hypothetical protein